MHRLRGRGALTIRRLLRAAAIAAAAAVAILGAPASSASASVPVASASTTKTSTTRTSTKKTPTKKTPTPLATASAYLLVDVDTGRVLLQKNAHVLLRPGSLTKMLVAMIAADYLPANAVVPVTKVAYNAYPDKVGMKPGQRWPLSNTMHSLITESANDAAYALAVDIGGSLAGFAPIMQQAAAQLGVTDHPVLEDPAGLDRSEGFRGGNKISAWDLAIFGRDLMANPQLARIAGEQSYRFTGPKHIVYSLLSENLHFLQTYKGALGVKTGFTDTAGWCEVEEAERGGRKMLTVELHGSDATSDALMNKGFATPVAAETADRSLPPVAEPERDAPTPATTTTTTTTTLAPAPAASLPLSKSRPGNHRVMAGGALGAVVILIGLVIVWRARRRNEPAHRIK